MTTAIAEYSATEAALADLEQRYKGVVFDVATRDGMASAIKGRAELRGYRVTLEKTRVEIKAPALERARLIDTEAKRIKDAITALEDPIDETIKAEETRKERERAERESAEAARLQRITDAINDVRSYPALFVGKASADIAAAIPDIAERVFDAQEFQASFDAEKAKAIAALEQLRDGARAREEAAAAEAARIKAEREELARLRAEQAERARQEELARQERAAAERKLMEAAMQRRIEEEKAARAVIDAERQEHQAKMAAERKAAQAERDEADRKAAEARAKLETALAAEREQVEREQKRIREDRVAKEAEEQALREAEAERVRQAQAEADRIAKAEADQLEAERREVERAQQETMATEQMIGILLERIRGIPAYDGIFRAILDWQIHAQPPEVAPAKPQKRGARA